MFAVEYDCPFCFTRNHEKSILARFEDLTLHVDVGAELNCGCFISAGPPNLAVWNYSTPDHSFFNSRCTIGNFYVSKTNRVSYRCLWAQTWYHDVLRRHKSEGGCYE